MGVLTPITTTSENRRVLFCVDIYNGLKSCKSQVYSGLKIKEDKLITQKAEISQWTLFWPDVAGSFLNNEMTIYPEVFSKNNSANINVTMNKGLRIIPTNFILDNFNGAKIVNGKYVCRDEVDKHSISSQ